MKPSKTIAPAQSGQLSVAVVGAGISGLFALSGITMAGRVLTLT